MGYALEDFTVDALAKLLRDPFQSGRWYSDSALARRIGGVERWAVDLHRHSCLFKEPTGFREALVYAFFLSGDRYTVYASNYRSANWDTPVNISGVELADPRFDVIRLPLTEAFEVHGRYGFGQEGRDGKSRFVHAINPVFCNAQGMPGGY